MNFNKLLKTTSNHIDKTPGEPKFFSTAQNKPDNSFPLNLTSEPRIKTKLQKTIMQSYKSNKQTLDTYVVTLIENKVKQIGWAAFCLQNGKIKMGTLIDNNLYEHLQNILIKIVPVEIWFPINQNLYPLVELLRKEFPKIKIEFLESNMYNETLGFAYFKQTRLYNYEIEVDSNYLALAALSALAKVFSPEEGHNMHSELNFEEIELEIVEQEDNLFIDSYTIKELELVNNKTDFKPTKSFFSHFNCSTHGGARFLRSTICSPFKKKDLIENVQKRVQLLLKHPQHTEVLNKYLHGLKYGDDIALKFFATNFDSFHSTCRLYQNFIELYFFMKRFRDFYKFLSVGKSESKLYLDYFRRINPSHLLTIDKLIKILESYFDFSLFNNSIDMETIALQNKNLTGDVSIDETEIKNDVNNISVHSVYDGLDAEYNNTDTFKFDIKRFNKANNIEKYIFMLKKDVSIFIDLSRHSYTRLYESMLEIYEQYRGLVSDTAYNSLSLAFNKKRFYHLRINKKKLSVEYKNDLESLLKEDLIYVETKKNCVMFSTANLSTINIRLWKFIIEIIEQTKEGIVELYSKIKKSIFFLYELNYYIAEMDYELAISKYCNRFDRVCSPYLIDKNFKFLYLKDVKVFYNQNFQPLNYFMSDSFNLQVIASTQTIGKTTYLKNLVYNIILAHMGCLLPAKGAILPIFDKLMTKFSITEISEQLKSSFTKELMFYNRLYQNLGQNINKLSLNIIDGFADFTDPDDVPKFFIILLQKLIKNNQFSIIMCQNQNLLTYLYESNFFPLFQFKDFKIEFLSEIDNKLDISFINNAEFSYLLKDNLEKLYNKQSFQDTVNSYIMKLYKAIKQYAESIINNDNVNNEVLENLKSIFRDEKQQFEKIY